MALRYRLSLAVIYVVCYWLALESTSQFTLGCDFVLVVCVAQVRVEGYRDVERAICLGAIDHGGWSQRMSYSHQALSLENIILRPRDWVSESCY